jgi:hypothetical protein
MRPEGVRNPYAPPVAPVVDERLTDERGKRPLPVALAVGALGLYVLMSALQFILVSSGWIDYIAVLRLNQIAA